MRSKRLLGMMVAVAAASGQDDALRRAAALDGEQKCAESEAIYARALGQGTPSAVLLNNVGNHYLICGDAGKARRYFEQLVKINPRHGNANLQLARLAAERHDGAQALRFLAAVGAGNPEMRLLRVEALYWAGRREEAKVQLDAVEKEANRDARLHYLYGLTCARIGAYDRAEPAFRAVLAAHPGDFDVMLHLGRAAARSGNYERAQQVLEAALRMQPANADVLVALGETGAGARDWMKSIYYFAQAAKAAPGRPEILLSLARAAREGAYYGDAAVAYEQYLRLAPGDEAARRDHALVAGYREDRRAEAVGELNSYIKTHPRDAVGYYNLAQLLWREDAAKAIALLGRATELDPAFAAAHLDRAWLLEREGGTEQALVHLRAAVKLDAKNFRALDLMGLALTSLGRTTEAEPVLRSALALAPDDPGVLMHLGRALMELGREEEGRRMLEKFRTLRPSRVVGPRRQAGLIEAASLEPAERTARELQRLRQDAEAHPDDPELQLNLASLLMAAGKVADAETEFRVLLSRSTGAEILERAGVFLLDSARYALARDFLERAARERPRANLELAIACFLAREPDKALEALARVPERETCGDCLLLNAAVLEASGHVAEAEAILTRGLELGSKRPKIAQLTAAMLVKRGKVKLAVDLLNRVAGGNQDLLFTKGVVLGLAGQTAAAVKVAKGLQSQWPEWDGGYLLHGLLLETSQPREAMQRVREALAVSPESTAGTCALARMTGAAVDPVCKCARGLADLLEPCEGR